MTTTNQKRDPRGAPSGGQFASQERPDADLELDVDMPSLRVGAGTRKGVNTDLTTREGLQAAFTFVTEEWPERPRFEHELILNIAASDWQAGHEDRVEKMLTREYNFTAAKRIIATLVATPGTPRG